MNIALFNDLTTDEYLTQLEEEGKKYEGLYVDMTNAPERKYVKEKAQSINDLLKKLDRARIDLSKDYKAKVEKEASLIKERLESANEPFTLLINEYKAERAKILAEEKKKEDARLLAIQKEDDHEMALLINKTYEFDKTEQLRLQKEHDEKIASEAAAEAIEQEKQRAARLEQIKKIEEQERLRNIEHVRGFNSDALNDLINLGLEEEIAKVVVMAIAKGRISHVTINY